MLIWSIEQWLKIITPSRAARAFTCWLCILCACAFLAARNTVIEGRVLSSEREFAALQETLQGLSPQARRDYQIAAPPIEGHKIRYDEHGILTSSFGLDRALLKEIVLGSIGDRDTYGKYQKE